MWYQEYAKFKKDSNININSLKQLDLIETMLTFPQSPEFEKVLEDRRNELLVELKLTR